MKTLTTREFKKFKENITKTSWLEEPLLDTIRTLEGDMREILMTLAATIEKLERENLSLQQQLEKKNGH